MPSAYLHAGCENLLIRLVADSASTTLRIKAVQSGVRIWLAFVDDCRIVFSTPSYEMKVMLRELETVTFWAGGA
jgi:flagellar biosynthesis regulator FlaF